MNCAGPGESCMEECVAHLINREGIGHYVLLILLIPRW